jgi:hypothetical protein
MNRTFKVIRLPHIEKPQLDSVKLVNEKYIAGDNIVLYPDFSLLAHHIIHIFAHLAAVFKSLLPLLIVLVNNLDIWQ